MIQATLELYRESAREASEALARTGLALLVLMLASPILGVVEVHILSKLSIVGGLIAGLLEAAAVGWYLSLLEIGVNGRRSLRFSDLREQLGAYFSEVISVLFVFWIAELVVSFVAPTSLVVLVPLATLVFNPTPEMVYQERTQSTQLLGDAAKFMQQNWPEWLVPHAAAAVLLAIWGAAVTGGHVSIADAVDLVQMFGPWFGFMGVFKLVVGEAQNLWGLFCGVLLLVFVHGFLLFRGNLYRRLRSSSRRSRAWAGRQ